MARPSRRTAKSPGSVRAQWACVVGGLVCCGLAAFLPRPFPALDDLLVGSAGFDGDGLRPCAPGTLTAECVNREAARMARAFPYRLRDGWCLPPDVLPVRKNRVLRQGLILTKVPKAASSTSAGVALRITDRNRCHPAQWEHRRGLHYGRRLRHRSVLFAPIRAPADRSLSSIFYHKLSGFHAAWETRGTDDFVLAELRGEGRPSDHTGTVSAGQGGFTLQYVSLTHIPEYSAWDPAAPTVVQAPEVVLDHVRRVLEDYDLLLVVDRMDESLVALSMLLGVPVGDVVVADSKVNGETYRLRKGKHVENSVCVPTGKSFKSPAVAAFLESDHWLASTYGDWVLHAAANKSLDLTIDMIGRDKFEPVLAEYRRLKTLVNERCADQVYLPCDPDGNLQLEENAASCYIAGKDFGCAHSCVDDWFDSIESSLRRDYSYIPLQLPSDGDQTTFKSMMYD